MVVRGGWFCKRWRRKGMGIEGGEGRGKGGSGQREPWEGGKGEKGLLVVEGKRKGLEQTMKSRRREGNESRRRTDMSESCD